MTTGTCGATIALPPSETQRLADIRGGAFTVAGEYCCELAAHDHDIWHVAFVQDQQATSNNPRTVWWITWEPATSEWLLINNAECATPTDGDEVCLLVEGHPGPCSPPKENAQ